MKTKAAAAVEGGDINMHFGDKDAVVSKESDPPEEDNNDSVEEELEDMCQQDLWNNVSLIKCRWMETYCRGE
jgi:hypothetical protein